jgi:hypothetical protein
VRVNLGVLGAVHQRDASTLVRKDVPRSAGAHTIRGGPELQPRLLLSHTCDNAPRPRPLAARTVSCVHAARPRRGGAIRRRQNQRSIFPAVSHLIQQPRSRSAGPVIVSTVAAAGRGSGAGPSLARAVGRNASGSAPAPAPLCSRARATDQPRTRGARLCQPRAAVRTDRLPALAAPTSHRPTLKHLGA